MKTALTETDLTKRLSDMKVILEGKKESAEDHDVERSGSDSPMKD